MIAFAALISYQKMFNKVLPFVVMSTSEDLLQLTNMSLYCPLSRYRKFTFYCRKREAPLFFWTEANKLILANQCAVFGSVDKATFTFKRRGSWEDFHQSWLKVIKDGSFWWTCDIFLRAKKENKSWNVFMEPWKSSTLQWWGKSSSYF